MMEGIAAPKAACLSTDFRSKATVDPTKRRASILAIVKLAVSIVRNMAQLLSGSETVRAILTKTTFPDAGTWEIVASRLAESFVLEGAKNAITRAATRRTCSFTQKRLGFHQARFLSLRIMERLRARTEPFAALR